MPSLTDRSLRSYVFTTEFDSACGLSIGIQTFISKKNISNYKICYRSFCPGKMTSETEMSSV